MSSCMHVQMTLHATPMQTHTHTHIKVVVFIIYNNIITQTTKTESNRQTRTTKKIQVILMWIR